MRSLIILFIILIIHSCSNSFIEDSDDDKKSVLTLADMPQVDTTGMQSIYREVSPYYVKGIDPPEGKEIDYDKPYSHFEFIQNAHSQLSSMGYEVGGIVEFSHNLLQDTTWAKRVFLILDEHSTGTYLGTERGFLDSIKNVNYILSSPIDTLKKKYE